MRTQMNWTVEDDVIRIQLASFSSTLLTIGVSCMNRVTCFVRPKQPGQRSKNDHFAKDSKRLLWFPLQPTVYLFITD